MIKIEKKSDKYDWLWDENRFLEHAKRKLGDLESYNDEHRFPFYPLIPSINITKDELVTDLTNKVVQMTNALLD